MAPFETLMKAVDPLLEKVHSFMGFTLSLKPVKIKQSKTKQKLLLNRPEHSLGKKTEVQTIRRSFGSVSVGMRHNWD